MAEEQEQKQEQLKKDFINDPMDVIQSSSPSGAWGLIMMISLLFSLAMGVSLIWISIARNDLGFDIFKLQKEIDNGTAHITKLEVERDSLLSPYVLDEKAKKLGLRIADPGQIRRLID